MADLTDFDDILIPTLKLWYAYQLQYLIVLFFVCISLCHYLSFSQLVNGKVDEEFHPQFLQPTLAETVLQTFDIGCVWCDFGLYDCDADG